EEPKAKMKAILDKFLWKIGFYGPIPLAPSRAFVDGPYANCYDMARNQACSIILDDNEFEIADGPSFYMMHREIYGDQSYLFRSQRDAPVIIDCGSNYGVSILWFKKNYPDAKIVGVEADPAVFDMLSRNISRRNFSDVKLLHRAVSSKSGHIPFHCLGADSGRIHAGSPDGISSSTEVIDVPTVLLDELIGEDEVDFLKIDIEGAELDVISGSKKLNRVNQMFIEYHSFIDVPQQLSRLLSILEDNGFRYYIDKVCSPQNPYLEITINQGMDLQLRIFATRPEILQAAAAGQLPA
ncbi:MAG: FkbM family methyltransferase, partial [Cyanobacteriota bacterium]